MPAAGSLANVSLPGAQAKQPVKLSRLVAVDRLDIKVQPVLRHLGPVGHGPEVDLEWPAVVPIETP
jgi:hypothetical protein